MHKRRVLLHGHSRRANSNGKRNVASKTTNVSTLGLPCAMGPAGWRSGAVKGARLCLPLLEVIVYRQLHLAIELHVRPCNRPLALRCTVLSSPTTEPARRLSSSRRAHLIYS
jgi:hypothetical protein